MKVLIPLMQLAGAVMMVLALIMCFCAACDSDAGMELSGCIVKFIKWFIIGAVGAIMVWIGENYDSKEDWND